MTKPTKAQADAIALDCSSSVAHEYGHLTEELIALLPDTPMQLADSFGDSMCAVRLRQMFGAYGDIAGKAYVEACRFKYGIVK